MTARTFDDRPPSYLSQDSQTSTLIDRPDPAFSAPLMPNHSTRASELSYATSRGRYSILEYYELTFPLLFAYNNIKKVIVVAVDEERDSLIQDLQRFYSAQFNSPLARPTFIRDLHVATSAIAHGASLSDDRLTEDNLTAMLRYLKSRNGVDFIRVK